MSEKPHSGRIQLIRDVVVLQIKLVVDGLRDALLIPLSLVAAAVGLLRGGENADQEFQRVLNLARRSEHWINVFGEDTPHTHSYPASSLDHLLHRVEAVVLEQYRKGRDPEEARAAINAAMQEESAERSEPGLEK